jgi:iron complex transport system substrate-binding protein
LVFEHQAGRSDAATFARTIQRLSLPSLPGTFRPIVTSGQVMNDFANLSTYPQRIVCLTEETTETLYLLGEGARVVGISGYTVRPKEARQKPKVSSFIKASYDKILALEPDLVFAFSDLQADIVAELIRRGVTVVTFNQRSLREILQMILTIGRLIGCEAKANSLLDQFQTDLHAIASSAAHFSRRPRVFFEEWYEPLISGIRWCEELLEIAGGAPLFPELRMGKAAQQRVVDPPMVIERNPEIIIASWCGRPVNKDWIRQRPGWGEIDAVRNNQIYEVKSSYILQPGPAALTEGVRQLHWLIAYSLGEPVARELWPQEKVDPAANVERTAG